MLEIIVLIFLTRHLNKSAKLKGHSGAYAALGPVLWFGGEITGALIGTIVTGEILFGIIIGLVFAAIGAGISLAVVGSLPNKYLDDGFDDSSDEPGVKRSADDVRENLWA